MTSISDNGFEMGDKTGFVRPGHIYAYEYVCIMYAVFLSSISQSKSFFNEHLSLQVYCQ